MGDLQTILTVGRSEQEALAQNVPQDVSAGEPPAKRPRVHAACENCRNRKTRCDGQRPVCAACLKRKVGDTCTYERQPRKTQSMGNDDQQPSFLLESPGSMQRKRASVSLLQASSDRMYDSSMARDHLRTAAPDAMSTMKARGDDNLYGPSSTIAFLNTISGDRSDEHSRSTNDQRASRTPNPQRATTGVPEKLNVSSTQPLFPRRRDADEFIRCYWDFVHPLWPLLHKSTFMDQYERMWASQDDLDQSEFEETLFTAALNLVFAIGCKYSTSIPAEHKKATGEEFYQRSRKMFCYDVLDAASLSMVQLLLLTVIYLQSTQYANRCWNTLGLAIRAAQCIGLHVESSERNPPQLQLEMNRRIWHVCVALDRLAGAAFGRPFGIQKFSMPAPTLIDDEYLRDNGLGRQPPEKIPQLGLFVYSCSLIDILHDILNSIYRDQSGLKTNPAIDRAQLVRTLDAVMQSTRRLDDLAVSLPNWLEFSIEPDVRVPAYIRLQQQVLYCRFLWVRLLSLRPLLLIIARRTDAYKSIGMTLDETMIRRCAEQCVSTAHDLIATLYTHLTDIYRSSAWHTTYFASGALMVLLSSLKSSISDGQDARFESSWNLGISILDYHKGEVKSAVDGISILQGLRQRIAPSKGSSEGISNGNNADPHGPIQTPASMNDQIGPIDLNADILDIIEMDSIGDAWFSQHLLESNWLDL